MEILQTVWTALTTENEVLANILIYCLGFFEVTITMLLFTTVLNINSNIKTKVIYVLTFTIFSILTNFFVPTPFNTFVNVFIAPLLVMYLFKTKIFTAILAELIPYTIFVLVGVVTLNSYIHLFNLTTDMVVTIPIYRVTSSLCTYIIVFIVYLALKHYKLNIRLLDSINLKSTTIFLVNFFIGVLAVCVQSYIASIYSDVLPFGIILLNISTLLFYFVFSLYSLIRTNKLEITERDLEQSLQYINTLTILHDSIRCFKHDFQNIVTTIGRLCTI